jgi:hypothetical protein
MLEGIEILNQTEIITSPEWTGIASITSLILIIIFFSLTCAALMGDKNKLFIGMFILTILSFIAFVTFNILDNVIEIKTGKYEYQVTINESVSMTEFHEKYEIIEVQGKIYTIKEKE